MRGTFAGDKKNSAQNHGLGAYRFLLSGLGAWWCNGGFLGGMREQWRSSVDGPRIGKAGKTLNAPALTWS